jgi:hypothetical protein
VSASTSNSPRSHLRLPPTELAVSRYDQVAGMLVAVLIVLGFITLLMFMLWLSTRLFLLQPPVAVTMLEDVGGGGSGENLAGGEQELQEPSPEEVQQVEEPSVTDSLRAISSIVSSEAQQLDKIEGSASYGKGEGLGQGDGRGPGPGGPGTSDGVPAWERWEIQMAAKTLDEYARRLDFFQVELGVAGGGDPNVQYISNLSAGKPKVRTGAPKDEKRLRFLHRSGELRQADRSLAAKAGVNTSGKVVFQFYSQDTYNKLFALETAKMGTRRIKDVRKTIFGVRNVGQRFEFFVIDQFYAGGA